MRMNENNHAEVAGEIIGELEFSHEFLGEKFYKTLVRTERLSGFFDDVPTMISERLLERTIDYTGSFIEIKGQFRSYNKRENEKNHLVLILFAREILFLESNEKKESRNVVFLEGTICKEPIYRITPKGREITDVILAVNGMYNKSSYIPLTVWGRDARYISGFAVGTKIAIQGRIQSRQYQKITDDGMEVKTAYEVSVRQIDILEESEG